MVNVLHSKVQIQSTTAATYMRYEPEALALLMQAPFFWAYEPHRMNTVPSVCLFSQAITASVNCSQPWSLCELAWCARTVSTAFSSNTPARTSSISVSITSHVVQLYRLVIHWYDTCSKFTDYMSMNSLYVALRLFHLQWNVRITTQVEGTNRTVHKITTTQEIQSSKACQYCIFFELQVAKLRYNGKTSFRTDGRMPDCYITLSAMDTARIKQHKIKFPVIINDWKTLFGPTNQTAMFRSDKILHIIGQLFKHVLQTEKLQHIAYM